MFVDDAAVPKGDPPPVHESAARGNANDYGKPRTITARKRRRSGKMHHMRIAQAMIAELSV